jgi:hypothetical protein
MCFAYPSVLCDLPGRVTSVIRHVVRVPEKRPAVGAGPNEEAGKRRLQRISPEANGEDITP